jgi:hypothetical protein
MTTTDRAADLKETLTAQYRSLRSLVEGLSEDDLSRPTENGWPVRKLAGHVIGSYGDGTIFVGKRLARGSNVKVPPGLSFIINLRNYVTTRSYNSSTKAELLSSLEAQQQRLMAWLATLPESALDNGGEVLDRGRMTLEQYLRGMSIDHANEHAASIKQAVAAG